MSLTYTIYATVWTIVISLMSITKNFLIFMLSESHSEMNTITETIKRYNFKLGEWAENRHGINLIVSASSWKYLQTTSLSDRFDLLDRPAGEIIHQFPEMNCNLVVTIQNNTFNFFVVDAKRVTAAAWCLQSKRKMILSEDGFLTFEEAQRFCQSRNATLWIPASKHFLKDPDFLADFESRTVKIFLFMTYDMSHTILNFHSGMQHANSYSDRCFDLQIKQALEFDLRLFDVDRNTAI